MCDQTIVYPADFPQSLDEISSLQIEFLIIFFPTSTLSSVSISSQIELLIVKEKVFGSPVSTG